MGNVLTDFKIMEINTHLQESAGVTPLQNTLHGSPAKKIRILPHAVHLHICMILTTNGDYFIKQQ